jgi:hypothetical protein
MNDILVQVHSIGRWSVLILLLAAIFKHATAGNRTYTGGDAKLGLFLTITADLMLLIGLYLYFAGNWGYNMIQSAGGMGSVMKNSVTRFFAIEHQVGMIIAIALLHIGKVQGKKNLDDKAKHRRTFIFYLLALLIILVSIPWPFREVGSGRGWI